MANTTTHGFHGHEIDECPWYSGLGFSFHAHTNSVDELLAKDALLNAKWIDSSCPLKARLLMNVCILYEALGHFSIAWHHGEFCK